MFDSDWRKAVIMLVIVAAEWWIMQPYHEPLIPRMWLKLARICYSLARKFGAMGIAAEHNYYEAV